MSERRHYPRRPIAVAATIDLESEHNFYAGVTSDISEGGVFIASDAPLEVGDEVDLALTLFANEVRARGEVRWLLTRDGITVGYGIEWTSIAPASLGVIKSFVESREPMLFEMA